MSQTTKNALSASLIKLLSKKTLDKITVSDITDDCGVNRQTFYYHFKDIYDLIEWTYKNGAESALGGSNSKKSWQDGYRAILERLLERRSFVINTYNSISREALERSMGSQLFILLRAYVEESAAGMKVSEDDKDFIAQLHMFEFMGHVMGWITSGMKIPPEEYVAQLSRVISGNIAAELDRCQID